MGYLSKDQHERRAESAARRNRANEEIAVENGMTDEQAGLISDLCNLRHELHTNLNSIATGGGNKTLNEIDDLNERIKEAGLQGVKFSQDITMIDDMYTLPDYADDVPNDHESNDFKRWYETNHARILNELEAVNNEIETYLREIDSKYKTHFEPTGLQRIF
nr:MAG TPA: Cpf1/RNA Complex FUNCTION-RNA complex.49A [Caudoviricetes sp.]